MSPFQVMINDPREWPKKGQFVASGQEVAFPLVPSIYTTSPEVRRVDVQSRQCIYSVLIQEEFF